MNHTKVKSTNIASIAHEGSTLEIKFKSGGTYQYEGVHPNTVRALMNSESKGEYFNTKIRPKYKHKLVK